MRQYLFNEKGGRSIFYPSCSSISCYGALTYLAQAHSSSPRNTTTNFCQYYFSYKFAKSRYFFSEYVFQYYSHTWKVIIILKYYSSVIIIIIIALFLIYLLLFCNTTYLRRQAFLLRLQMFGEYAGLHKEQGVSHVYQLPPQHLHPPAAQTGQKKRELKYSVQVLNSLKCQEIQQQRGEKLVELGCFHPGWGQSWAAPSPSDFKGSVQARGATEWTLCILLLWEQCLQHLSSLHGNFLHLIINCF